MSEAELTSHVESILWPLLAGGLGALAYLLLLSSAHLRDALLTGLCRDVTARRERQEQEDRKQKEPNPRVAAHFRKFERDLYELARRQGLAAAPEPKPAAPPLRR